MGNAMLKRVVVEGVETAADIETLAVLGDVDLQVFYFSRPQPSRPFWRSWPLGVQGF